MQGYALTERDLADIEVSFTRRGYFSREISAEASPDGFKRTVTLVRLTLGQETRYFAETATRTTYENGTTHKDAERSALVCSLTDCLFALPIDGLMAFINHLSKRTTDTDA